MRVLSKAEALQETIATIKGKKHPHYERVTTLADKYLRLITGENLEPLLKQFNPREDSEMFKQRVALTKSVVGAVSNKVKGPFQKVARSNNVTRELIFTDDPDKNRISNLESALEEFWGDESLDDYMEDRIISLSFSDPNSFIVTEQMEINGEIKVFPFEVSSYDAVNYQYTNNQLDFLVVSPNKTKYTTYTAEFALVLVKKFTAENPDANGDIPKKEMPKGVNLVTDTEQISEKAGETQIKIGASIYDIWLVPNECKEIPAIRVGYLRDDLTDGNTYLTPMHHGIPRMEKILKSDSELDMTISLHTFPQKLQYVQKCPGNPAVGEICDNGTIRHREEQCGTCKGQGYLFHTSAQDALIYPLPTQEELNAGHQPMDLDKILVYKHPAIELIKFQNEYTRQLEDETVKDVFISQNFEKANGVQTATEITNDLESVYDTLWPFARKFSSIYKKQVRITACHNKLDNGLTVVHKFPKDLKFKTLGQLFEDLKKAVDANAPEFVIRQINDDIASKIWHDNPTALKKYNVKQQHAPFSGKTAQQIHDIISSGRSTEAKALLWVEFENILQQLQDESMNSEEETPRSFFDIPYEERVELIEAKLQEVIVQKATERGVGALNLPPT